MKAADFHTQNYLFASDRKADKVANAKTEPQNVSQLFKHHYRIRVFEVKITFILRDTPTSLQTKFPIVAATDASPRMIREQLNEISMIEVVTIIVRTDGFRNYFKIRLTLIVLTRSHIHLNHFSESSCNVFSIEQILQTPLYVRTLFSVTEIIISPGIAKVENETFTLRYHCWPKIFSTPIIVNRDKFGCFLHRTR